MSDSSSDFWGALVDGGFQIGGQALGQSFNKKNMRRMSELQYEYAQRYAENSPSWNVVGLRAAGLNPILAVSNGVNLGANIPNITSSTPDGKINTKFTEAFGRAAERSVNQQNADANTVNADSQSTSAAADMLRAKSDAALKQAQTAETLQRTKFEGQGKGYKNDVVNDLTRGAFQLSESAQEFNKESEHYLQHAPDSSNYNKDTFFGGIQARIDADNEVKRITGKSVYEVSKMPDSEKIKILQKSNKAKYKSRGYHIFTR